MTLLAWRLLRLGGVVVLAALMLCGCANSTGSRTHDALLEIPVPKTVTVTANQVAGLGKILVDPHGRTLYMFPPDAGGRVTCTGACAGTWPPLVIASGNKPTSAAGVNPLDLGTLTDPNTGASVVTYGGYPLYRYAGDLAAGTANGQGLYLNGGPWYALNPDMQPVTTTPSK